MGVALSFVPEDRLGMGLVGNMDLTDNMMLRSFREGHSVFTDRNGPKALADITMVASNPKIDNGTWTCGKDGQSCPVTCGMPSALVSKLTVGGE